MPALSGDFSGEVIDYLLAHPKPTLAAVPAMTGHLGLVAALAAAGIGLALQSARSTIRRSESRSRLPGS